MSTYPSYIPKPRIIGRCYCPKTNFYKRFMAAESVVLGYPSLIYLAQGTTRNNLIDRYVYKIQARIVFKGPMKRTEFQAEAYDNPDLCGLQLRRRVGYLLFLDSRSDISIASSTSRNTYQLDQCQRHYAWKTVTQTMMDFIYGVSQTDNVYKVTYEF